MLQILYRLSHFDFVKGDDLERIGMGKPAIRRLMDTVKKKRKKKGFLDKVRMQNLWPEFFPSNNSGF